jgi:hypothetical protein
LLRRRTRCENVVKPGDDDADASILPASGGIEFDSRSIGARRSTLTRVLHKSGRKLYVEMTFAIVKDDDEGEVLGSVAMARDLTDRVERERAAARVSGQVRREA